MNFPAIFLPIHFCRVFVNEAKNEIYHLCAEAAETGDVGPLLEDAIALVVEEVLSFEAEECSPDRRGRVLHEARVNHATTSWATSRIVAVDHRGRRSLRKTHPKAAVRTLHRSLAPRVRHLRFNHFTRPPRRRHLEACTSTELLDGLSIKGGYDGSQIFFKLELDVSKGEISDIRDIILKPLQLLSESDFFNGKDFFGGGAASAASVFDNIDADISFSAGAHLGATGENGIVQEIINLFVKLINIIIIVPLLKLDLRLKGVNFSKSLQ